LTSVDSAGFRPDATGISVACYLSTAFFRAAYALTARGACWPSKEKGKDVSRNIFLHSSKESPGCSDFIMAMIPPKTGDVDETDKNGGLHQVFSLFFSFRYSGMGMME
jgi:hypothetical protein